MNKKNYIIILLVCLALFVYLLGSKSKNIPGALLWRSDQDNCFFMDFGCKENNIIYGAYDPNNLFGHNQKINIDHYYFSWLDFDTVAFQEKVEDSKQKNRKLFVTLEPWVKSWRKPTTLFEDIEKGEYDPEIKKVCTELSKIPEKVKVVFAHEMDHDLTERYDWSGKDPAEFIKSYRYFINECRKIASNILYVWSPVGNSKALDYWPGDEYVDYVGFPVYSFPDFDVIYYGHARSFIESVEEKYERLAKLGKPLIIVELGVAGDDARKSEWIENMYKNVSKLPLIESILFFNARDHEDVWGENFSIPDWRIKEELIQ